MSVGDREREDHAALEPLGERGEERAVDGVQVERVGTVDPLARELVEQAVIDSIYPFEDAAEAHKKMVTGKGLFGKLILTPN